MSPLDTLLDFDAALEWQDADDPLLGDVAPDHEVPAAAERCPIPVRRLIA